MNKVDKLFIGKAVRTWDAAAGDITDEEVWRTSEEGGRHFKIETETGEIKAGFGGKLNGQKADRSKKRSQGKSKEEQIAELKNQIAKTSRFGEAGKQRAELKRQLKELEGNTDPEQKPEQKPETPAPVQPETPKPVAEKPSKEQQQSGNQREYTANEKHALESYVSGDAMWINQYLRNPSEFGSLNADEKAMLKDLTTATEANEVSDKTLYRSVDAQAVFGRMSDMDFSNLRDAVIYGDSSRFAQNALQKAQSNLGRQITENGFMSTTRDPNVAYSWDGYTGSTKDITLELSVPKGTKGADVSKMFEVGGDEQNEVLLQRGLKYVPKKIGRRDTDDGSKIVVTCDIIGK